MSIDFGDKELISLHEITIFTDFKVVLQAENNARIFYCDIVYKKTKKNMQQEIKKTILASIDHKETSIKITV